MPNLNNVPETLFEIIDSVLLQFQDANLNSDEARKKIADEICNKYYDDITPDIEEYENIDTFVEDIMQQGE